MSNTADETKSAPPASTPSSENDGNAADTPKSSQQCAPQKLPERITPIQFLISNLRGGKGYSSTNHHITLILELHGIYDLVSTVYDIARSERLTSDSINSHLWNVSFNSVTYANGWRREDYRTGDWDREANERDIDLGERRIFSNLDVRKGMEGQKSGESLTFNFEVVRVEDENTVASNDVLVKIPQSIFVSEDRFHTCGGGKKGDVNVTYPKISKIALNLSGNLCEDWIGNDFKAQSSRLRDAWARYNSGMNSWTRDRRNGGWKASKPLSPPWGGDEMTIIGLLINAGCKFKKSWDNILQHTFVDRTESSASMKWYQLAKKDYFMIQHDGKGMTNEARIQLAKRLAKRHLDLAIKQGRAAKDPHPDARIEGLLRKRGLITDNTDEYERRRLCAMHRLMDDDDFD